MGIQKFFISILFTFSVSASAAPTTISLYNTAGTLSQYCTDANGVTVNAIGAYATGVTLGACAIVPPPPPPQVNQLTRGTIVYQYNQGTVGNVDLTLLKNIVGRNNATQAIVDFPYRNGSAPTIQFQPTKVLIAKMIIPTTGTASPMIKNTSYYSSPGVTVSISTVPGDFTNVPTACVKHNALNNDAPMIYMRSGGSANSYICTLVPGGTYYLNMKFESATQSGPITLTWY